MVLSLAALALTSCFVFMSARTLDRHEERPAGVGFMCLTFAPVILALWLGQLSLVFGLLPLAAGYLLLVKKKPLAAGLVWSLLAIKPAFWIVAMANAIVQAFNKRYGLLATLSLGTSVVVLPGLLMSQDVTQMLWYRVLTMFSVQPDGNPRLDIAFQYAAMSFAPDRVGLFPVVTFVGVIVAIGGFMQLYHLAKAENKERDLVPFTTMLATFLPAILLPHMPFFDLSVLALGGLIAYCTDWREHLEFRTRTVARLTWLCVNGYLIAFYFTPAAVHPFMLVAALLLFYMRLAETVRFAAHVPSD
jgi:hypothetical protein